MDKYWLFYCAVISLLALALTGYDKWAARQGGLRRIPERTLMLAGALGGALSMNAMMRLIRPA